MGFAARLRIVQDRIARACDRSCRNPDDVTLIAVSKTVSLEMMAEAYEAGQRHFGESRLQEALPKIEALPRDIVWHFVGTLQSNKARRVAEVFNVIHSIDGEGQLKEVQKVGGPIDVLLEVNLAREAQKSGVLLENLDGLVQRLSCYRDVHFRGLMTIGPLSDDPEQSRDWFRELALIGKRLGTEWLSMGMSADYDVAVQEGATHVRVGTALFGERD